MTVDDLFRALSDMDHRASQLVFEGADADAFVDAMNSIDPQPQLLIEDQALIRERKHVIFLAHRSVEGRAIPEDGDRIIGSLCGRIAIVPKERKAA